MVPSTANRFQKGPKASQRGGQIKLAPECAQRGNINYKFSCQGGLCFGVWSQPSTPSKGLKSHRKVMQTAQPV